MTARPRRDLAVLAIVCAVALAATALTRTWFSSKPEPGIEISMGLWGVELCHHGCQGKRWDDVPGAEDDVTLAGYLGVVAAPIAAVLVVIVAVGAVQGRRGPMRAARTALAIALAAMGYFLLRNLIDGGRLDPDPSWGGFVAIAAAIGAHQALRRLG